MSIFFRDVDPEIVNELKKRYDGTTAIRNTSFKVKKAKQAAKAARRNYREIPKRLKSWIEIYDEDGNFFYGYGKAEYADRNRKVTVETYNARKGKNIPVTRTAYLMEKLDVNIAGDYGTLRNFSFNFSINVRQPEEINASYDEVFTHAQNVFGIGKKILIKYGWNEEYEYVDRRSGTIKRKPVEGYNPKVHKHITDTTIPGGASKLGGETGLVFTVVKPEYSVSSLNRLIFSVSGVGPGAQLSEKNIAVSQPSYQFDDIFKKGLKGDRDKYYKDLSDKQIGAYFTTNFDASVDEGKHQQVQDIVDWIDFDVQSHVVNTTKLSFFNNFTANNGAANIGVYAKPPVDRVFTKGDTNGNYEQTGFVIFELDAEYYDNQYTIEDDYDGDLNYTYYVTLQYLVWLFNWILNTATIPVDTPNSERDNLIKNNSMEDVYNYQIICSPSVTKGNLEYTDDGVTDTDTKYYLPSAYPFNVLFSYGSAKDDPQQASNYGANFEKYRWWVAAVATVVGVVVGVFTAGVLGGIVGTSIALLGYYDELINKLQFTHSDPDQPQVHDIRTGESSQGIQDKFSMAPNKGNLANILVNRDCIAAIIDELGGLTRSKEKADDDVSSVTAEKFFGKLFDLIKEASGDAIQLQLVPDPDNTERYLSKSLIVNANEPPDPNKTIQVPMFNKTDGSTIEMTLKSKISKASQTSAAVGGAANIATPPKQLTPDEGTAANPKTEIESGVTAKALQIREGKDSLVKSTFKAEKSRALSGVLKSLVTGEPDAKAIGKGRRMPIFELSMSLSILGLEGFRFGDTISSKLLPPQYRRTNGITVKTVQGKKQEVFNTKTVFTVTKINHVFKKSEWVTTLDTQMRFVPGDKVAIEPIDKFDE